jgi:Skp family chaperone for outer membrane proteins
MKFGSVDLSAVAEQSKLGNREKTEFDALRTKLTQLLQFMNTNKVMTREQGTKLRELWLAEKPTDAQKTELENLKTAIQKSSQELRDLLGKLNPDEKDQARIRELLPLSNATDDQLPALDNQYGLMMRSRADAKQQEVLDKARAAAQKLGKQQGYTVIFESQVAVYAANDVTPQVLQVMDADNP